MHIYEASSCPPLNIDQLNRLSRFHRIIFKVSGDVSPPILVISSL